MIYGIGIHINDARIIELDGTKQNFTVNIVTPKLSIPATDSSIESIIDFQKNFEMLIQSAKPSFVVLCEGGEDSKKKRIRMEFSILCACTKNSIKYETYASNATSRYINSGYANQTGTDFEEFYKTLNIPGLYKKAFAVAWRYFE